MGRTLFAVLTSFALGSGACMVADAEISNTERSLSADCFDTGDGVVCANDPQSGIEADPGSVVSMKGKTPTERQDVSSDSSSSDSSSSDSSLSDSSLSDSSSSDSSSSDSSLSDSSLSESSLSESSSSEPSTSEPPDGGGSACPADPTGSELTQGTVEAIDFDGATLVNQLLFGVDIAWLGAGTHSLAIEITGLNGGFEYHGNQVIAVDDTVVFDTEMDTAFVVGDWSADATPRQVNEVYTVCVQVLVCDTATGPIKCQDYGPF